MNSEQMRELADILEPMAAAPVFERLDIPGAVALLRQCAEQRPCTCHPDDNPPVPCARKYALSECREAPQREPVLIDLLTQAEKCLAAGVRVDQTAPDEPPMPVSEWDYEAERLSAEILAWMKVHGIGGSDER